MTNFKKFLASASAAVMMLTAVTASGITASASNFRGDLNNDNKVDAADVTLMARYLQNCSVSINKTNADMNCDGSITIFDYQRLYKLVNTLDYAAITCTKTQDAYLRSGERIYSPARNYYAIMQTDGNLVVYYKGLEKDTAIWDTHTNSNSNKGSYLAIQKDGNLVIYNKNGNNSNVVWASGSYTKNTSEYTAHRLTLDNDGVLHVTRVSDNTVRWSSEDLSKGKAAREAQIRIKSKHVYSSPDEAARDFVIAYNGISVAQNREYGSVILELGENRYTLYEIRWGVPRGDSISGKCGRDELWWGLPGNAIAYVHTHGKERVPKNLEFSDEDLDSVDGNTYNCAYLGNARGEIRKYSYDRGHEVLESANYSKYVDKYEDQIIAKRQDKNGDGIYRFY